MTVKLWDPKEIELIKNHFHDIQFSSWHGSRFVHIGKILKANGFVRTPKAIARKSFRLGLKSVHPKLYLKEVKCRVCKNKFMKSTKYIGRDKTHRCQTCQRLNNGYSTREKYLNYHVKYNAKVKVKT